MVRRLYHRMVGACQGNFRYDDCYDLSSAYAQTGSLTAERGVVVCWSYHRTFTVVAFQASFAEDPLPALGLEAGYKAQLLCKLGDAISQAGGFFVQSYSNIPALRTDRAANRGFYTKGRHEAGRSAASRTRFGAAVWREPHCRSRGGEGASGKRPGGSSSWARDIHKRRNFSGCSPVARSDD